MPVWATVILLGILEGVTEFLPISSTGHLLVAEHWLPRQSQLFNIVIQCGAVLAVIPLFKDRFHQFFFRWREPATRLYLLKIFVACVITGGPGYVLEKKGFKLPEELEPVAIALFVGGVLFIFVERWLRDRHLKGEITWGIVVAVGIGQLIAAVFPGTSRSGASILLALVLGLERVAATEFSFLVGIPTMLAAGGLKVLKALHHTGGSGGENWGLVGLGFAVAGIVSFLAVKWLLRYVQTHTFVAFGWYRIFLSIVIGVLLLKEGGKLHADSEFRFTRIARIDG